jgi:hypothetical protein
MNRRILLGFLALASLPGSDVQWVLASSSVTYHVSHTLHESEGTSHMARGKGVCHSGQCDFLIAVPVKSFESGDSNKDLHMMQVTHGAQFPLVSVRVSLPEAALALASIRCDVEVEFAGQTAKYKDLTFQAATKGNATRITGSIPAKLADFKIEPPSLLSIPVKNDMPVRVDMTWRLM